MNFIDKQTKSVFITLLRDYVVEQKKLTTNLTMKNNILHINDIPLDKLLSRKEYRIFKFFLEHQNELIARDILAEQIWLTNSQEKYSDWAIDQLIARVRKRINELAIGFFQIHSVRGKGYQLTHL